MYSGICWSESNSDRNFPIQLDLLKPTKKIINDKSIKIEYQNFNFLI